MKHRRPLDPFVVLVASVSLAVGSVLGVASVLLGHAYLAPETTQLPCVELGAYIRCPNPWEGEP